MYTVPVPMWEKFHWISVQSYYPMVAVLIHIVVALISCGKHNKYTQK